MAGNEPAADAEILQAWYRYAAKHEGFVGEYLRLVRERQGITEEEQKEEFGASDEVFARLEGIVLPRPRHLAADAQRIAEDCGLQNPLAFVQAMVLAVKIHGASPGQQAYKAAFDAAGDLDTLADEE